jgi:tRNA modification GTPase
LSERLENVRNLFDSLTTTVEQGCLLRDGVTIVLAGRPNAGKSSLLNALAGYDAAIVTDIAGTTRDLVREQIELHGLTVNIIDTAGLRDSGDAVEAEGVRRAQRELANADHALIILDSTSDEGLDDLLAEVPAGIAYTVVRNKADLSGEQTGLLDSHTVAISATTGEGLDELRTQLEQALGFQPAGENSVTARRRHLESLHAARTHFDEAYRLLKQESAGELMAEELLQVQNSLAKITGQFSSDDLLGRIFADFCIGK